MHLILSSCGLPKKKKRGNLSTVFLVVQEKVLDVVRDVVH